MGPAQADATLSNFVPAFEFEDRNQAVIERLVAIADTVDKKFNEVKDELKTSREELKTMGKDFDTKLDAFKDDVNDQFKDFDNKLDAFKNDVNDQFKTMSTDFDTKLDKGLDVKLQTLLYKLLGGAAVVATVASTSGAWFPVATSLAKAWLK